MKQIHIFEKKNCPTLKKDKFADRKATPFFQVKPVGKKQNTGSPGKCV
jgi:hypothetical protein